MVRPVRVTHNTLKWLSMGKIFQEVSELTILGREAILEDLENENIILIFDGSNNGFSIVEDYETSEERL
ncbi:MAG: hypothetical protein ACREOZ_01920 [Gloeomargaritales cyanobacterium]